jgi:hypothetical protein
MRATVRRQSFRRSVRTLFLGRVCARARVHKRACSCLVEVGHLRVPAGQSRMGCDDPAQFSVFIWGLCVLDFRMGVGIGGQTRAGFVLELVYVGGGTAALSTLQVSLLSGWTLDP